MPAQDGKPSGPDGESEVVGESAQNETGAASLFIIEGGDAG
jgi:hypothetical protein